MTPPNIPTRSRGKWVTLSVPQVLVYKINNTPFVYRPILRIIYGPLYHFKRVSRSRFVSTSSYFHVKIKPSNVRTNSNILSQWLHIFLLKFSHFVNGQYFHLFPSSYCLHNTSTINNKMTPFHNDSKRIFMRGVHSRSLTKDSSARVSLNEIQKPDSKWGPPLDICDQSNEVKRRSTYKCIISF